MRICVIQRVGDRNKECWSMKEIAFTLTANAQGKVQLLIWCYDD